MEWNRYFSPLVLLIALGCSSAATTADESTHANSNPPAAGGASTSNAAGAAGLGEAIEPAAGIAGNYTVVANAGSAGNMPVEAAGGGTSTSDGPGIGGGSTSDPPIGSGGTTSDGVGGGTTADPGSGGGSTEDPGTGGGATDDPGTGGGNTDDPGVGGGSTGDPGSGGATQDPGTGGTNSPGLGGATQDPGTGGTTSDPGTGGSTADGGTGGTHEECPWVCVPAAIEGVNLLVLNDANPSGADVEGRMYVGNNAILPSGYAVNAAGTTASTNDYVLVVGNNLTTGSGTVHGAIAYGGEYSGTITATGGVTQASPVDFEQLASDMIYWSDTLAETPANGTVGTGGSLSLVGTDLDVNVFEVQAADLANANQLTITVPEGSTVLVNVIGTDISITNMGFEYIGTDSQHVIFNMAQAETIFMSGISLQGTLLAPRAELNFENGNAEGQTIVWNLTTGGGEYHPYYFEGCPWECL